MVTEMNKVNQIERRTRILELIQQQGIVVVSDLCELFGVSEMTIRRDLRDMDREGLLRRVHGGAVNSLGRSYEPPYVLRSTQNAEAKRRIGRKAAELIYEGDSIALDVGTTTLEIARAIQHCHNITVVTSSLPIANEIATNCSLENNIRLILTGGIVRTGELSMIGMFPERVYADLHVDRAFIGVGGLSLKDGLTEYNLEDALIKRRLLASAHQVIVVADSSKFGKTTFATVGPLSMVNVIITDVDAPADQVQALREMGITVLIAE